MNKIYLITIFLLSLNNITFSQTNDSIKMIQLYDQVNELLSNNNYKEAILKIDEIIKLQPGNATLYFTQGNIYESIHDEEQAIISYENAIKLDSNNFNSNYSLGAIYYNKAIGSKKQIPQISDKDKVNLLNEQINNNFKKALPYFESCYVIEKNNGSTSPHIKMKDILLEIYLNMKLDNKYNQLIKE